MTPEEYDPERIRAWLDLVDRAHAKHAEKMGLPVRGGVVPEPVGGYLVFPEGTFHFLDGSPLTLQGYARHRRGDEDDD